MDIYRVTIPTISLEDAYYSLLFYLMKSYSDVRVAGRRFNYILNRYRMVVECACD